MLLPDCAQAARADGLPTLPLDQGDDLRLLHHGILGRDAENSANQLNNFLHFFFSFWLIVG